MTAVHAVHARTAQRWGRDPGGIATRPRAGRDAQHVVVVDDHVGHVERNELGAAQRGAVPQEEQGAIPRAGDSRGQAEAQPRQRLGVERSGGTATRAVVPLDARERVAYVRVVPR